MTIKEFFVLMARDTKTMFKRLGKKWRNARITSRICICAGIAAVLLAAAILIICLSNNGSGNVFDLPSNPTEALPTNRSPERTLWLENSKGDSLEQAVIARLDIEGYKEDMPVVEKATAVHLKTAVAHYSLSAPIGDDGLCILVAHSFAEENGYFHMLGSIDMGCVVSVRTESMSYKYKVASCEKIPIDDLAKLVGKENKYELLLITYYSETEFTAVFCSLTESSESDRISLGTITPSNIGAIGRQDPPDKPVTTAQGGSGAPRTSAPATQPVSSDPSHTPYVPITHTPAPTISFSKPRPILTSPPKPTPTPRPTPILTESPSPSPTPEDTAIPSPSDTPPTTLDPTEEPTLEPTSEPTAEPTPELTEEPTAAPEPTPSPTVEP